MASGHVRYQTDGTCTLSTTPVSSNYDNQLGGTFTYDGSGDLTYDGTNTLTYDAEGRIATSTASGSTTTYVYGADGQRIGKIQGGVETNYARGTDGSLLATYVGGTFNGYPQEMWVGGKHFGTVTVGTNGTQTSNFSLTNWLGSEVAHTNSVTGVPCAAYLSQPYGDSQTALFDCDTDDIHFTGKERDTESGNDYFGARYYASSMGRWLSPDPSGLSYSDPSDPQSLNLYAYVGNHALQYVDPYGLSWFNQPCTDAGAGTGPAYTGENLFGRITTFIGNVFCGGGGGSGPDSFPDSGRPITKRPFRQPLSQMDVAERVYDVKQNFSKPCKKAYSGVGKHLGIPFSMSKFARSLENGELDQHPNEEPQDSSADATTEPSGARNIHTWANFYGESSNTQGFILWHELTHKNFRIGDDENNAPEPGLDFNNQFAPYGYRGDYDGGGTADFTDWLQGGCSAQ